MIVNTDLPNTTLVGAYVGGGNQNGVSANLDNFGDITTTAGAITGTAYMATVQNKSLPMTTVTATYYAVSNVAGSVDADILWGDVAIAPKDLPMGLKLSVQGGQISPDLTGAKDTNAFGAKVDLKPTSDLAVCVAYTTVNDGTVGIKNTGGVKTPLYTQMILNQGALYFDNDTYMLKAVYNTGKYGKIIAQGTMTNDNTPGNTNATSDLTDLELVYKVNAGGVNFLAAYVNQSWDLPAGAAAGTKDGQDLVRLVARYNF